MLRNISKLEYSAFAAVLIIIFFSGVIIVLSCMGLHDGTVSFADKRWGPTFPAFFNSLAVIALAYSCQMNVFPIWSELENPTPARMNIVNIAAMCLSSILYIMVGIFGYIKFPETSSNGGNVLQALPQTTFYIVLRCFFVFAILFHYPVVAYAFRLGIEEIFFSAYKFNWLRHTIETIMILCFTLFCAIKLPNLTDVFGLTGALAAFPICFTIPAFCYVRLVYYGSENLKTTRFMLIHLVLPIIVMIFSTIAMIVGIVTSVKTLIQKY